MQKRRKAAEPQPPESNETFHCNCGGPIRIEREDYVWHACKRKYAHSTSYYDGIERFAPLKRIQINPRMTNGEIAFNWFLDWQTRWPA